jgi:hypothetical protein
VASLLCHVNHPELPSKHLSVFEIKLALNHIGRVREKWKLCQMVLVLKKGDGLEMRPEGRLGVITPLTEGMGNFFFFF